ncbi:TVP38/TMEM64 family protein [Legionella jordanis]|uniref:TVP38/TMEM64 family membrane protein n=1 Tax=Legionella jordanis TaxID=456 RepID=A0A0W0VEX0_9GAMM|nr:TVP38/TMEM64 family protein [Legionella jordanis]KTD18358.1 putative integral inner membrane protein [Legionella jordanis]RMX05269.1 TVP38/TMEM64 family protein [Legionella jordanis]RMX20880.1 TVP38/TMEM64 family protein [Legionella jordanis]VEH13296.1 putative integral inner membrane protein [Legionella jordanis]HAT8713644.1 TVP38/TMEM64 family protein [Legionella jordanis]
MRVFCTALAIAAFIASAYLFQQNAPSILNAIKHLGWLAPFLFIVIYGIATILLLPTMVLTLTGGALFGPTFGTLLNLIGASFGAALAFLISRHLATDWFSGKRGPRMNKLILGVENNGWQFVALLRLVPIIPFNLVNYGLGLTGIKFSHYLITTLIFLTPAEIVYTYCGYAGMGVLMQQNTLYKSSGILLLVFLIIGVMLFKLVRHYQNKRMKMD